MAKSYETVKLDEGIFSVCGTWLGKTFSIETRSFIINNNESGILVIDTCGTGSGRIIFDSVKNAGLNPADIKGIAFTHWHSDHTGGAAELVSLVNDAGGGLVKIFIHDADAELFFNQKRDLMRIHPLLKLQFYNKPGELPCKEQSEFIRLFGELQKNPLEGWGVDFIHTPGHTPGHTSFFHRKSMSLFSGSALSFFGDNIAGIVPFFSDREMQIESARKLMETDFRFLYPAHMKLKREEIPLKRRVPFEGKIPFIYNLMGVFPIFSYITEKK